MDYGSNDAGDVKVYKMSRYLNGSTYYSIPGLDKTNVLGEECTTMVPQGICRMDDYILITIYDGTYVWIAEGENIDDTDNGVGAIKKSDIVNAINVSVRTNAKSVKLKNIKAPQYTQGICFYKSGSNIYMGLSISYGRKNTSKIKCYRLKDYYDPKSKYKGVLKINWGTSYKTIVLPSMSEQISLYSGFMYCIFESGAKPYVDGSDGKGLSANPIGSFCMFPVNMIFK